MISPENVLMIEPANAPSAKAVVDHWTRKTAMVYAATRIRHEEGAYRGTHTCICGAMSDNVDHYLSDGRFTNSLAVHYVAWHRGDVPDEELAKIDEVFAQLFPDFDLDADATRQTELLAVIPRPGLR